ncbi:dTDP-4-dehydrorhamnose 3,5-epimerase [Aurantimicrobium minutum]|uniref:dTDP-4-dehydrorhamnose 3,5-epimerase n=1 Tax=Aurantimicrobium minutum TaxID=708131 RepID=UPI002475D8A4|nr:dTDP-4-dehydrorhamnose 3,5-epimerase [Aurantimicrobium minutum]MDH6531766.1 dTDP-4-dehydrorhamnose 3,5-epimerase [Aurantimicrobium minutum]
MQIRELKIPDTYEITPRQHKDDRGVFLEWYRFDKLVDVVGHPLNFVQGNTSVSKRGTVRGIHFAEIPPSQAKYVTATHGAVLDFVIDIRVGSPTFGQWDSVLLDDVNRRAIYISEGIGHCFVALTDNATVSYLVTATFNAEREHGINPLDPAIGLDFGIDSALLLLSPKDLEAPTLENAQKLGLLPSWEQARGYYESLSKGN